MGLQQSNLPQHRIISNNDTTSNVRRCFSQTNTVSINPHKNPKKHLKQSHRLNVFKYRPISEYMSDENLRNLNRETDCSPDKHNDVQISPINEIKKGNKFEDNIHPLFKFSASSKILSNSLSPTRDNICKNNKPTDEWNEVLNTTKQRDFVFHLMSMDNKNIPNDNTNKSISESTKPKLKDFRYSKIASTTRLLSTSNLPRRKFSSSSIKESGQGQFFFQSNMNSRGNLNILRRKSSRTITNHLLSPNIHKINNPVPSTFQLNEIVSKKTICYERKSAASQNNSPMRTINKEISKLSFNNDKKCTIMPINVNPPRIIRLDTIDCTKNKKPKEEDVNLALLNKLKLEKEERRKAMMIARNKDNKDSMAEKKRVWKGGKGIFKKELLQNWYNHMEA